MDFLFSLVIITSVFSTGDGTPTVYKYEKIETFETKELCVAGGNAMVKKAAAAEGMLMKVKPAILAFECLERGKPKK